MSKFEEFETAYINAVKSIKKYQEDEDIGVLVNWLLETDSNPYSFLDDETARYTYTAEGFSTLCHLLHHALIDDGDVSFYSIDGRPQIKFVWRYEMEEETRLEMSIVRTEDDKPKLHKEEVPCVYHFYENYHEWITAKEIYDTEDLKRCYLWDKEISGEEFANQHYEKYKRFDPEWKTLEVERRKKDE